MIADSPSKTKLTVRESMAENSSGFVNECTEMPPKIEYKASVSNEIGVYVSFSRFLFPAIAKVVIFFEMKLSKLNQNLSPKFKSLNKIIPKILMFHYHIHLSPHHPIITSPHYHIITSSHHHIITLPHYHITKLSHYHITTSSHHPIINDLSLKRFYRQQIC